MESKINENQGGIVKAFLLMVVVLGFIGGFVFSGDFKNLLNNFKKEEEKTESSDVFTAAIKDNKTLGFDDKYVVTNVDADYEIDFGTYAGSTDLYFKLGYGNSKKDIKVSRYNYDNEDVQEYTLTFTNAVVDVYFGQIDNDPDNNIIFYLLDNGDVCYSIVEDMVQKDSYGTYTQIDNLHDVVKFYNGNACYEDSDCTSTIFAQTKNGKIYDLAYHVILNAK